MKYNTVLVGTDGSETASREPPLRRILRSVLDRLHAVRRAESDDVRTLSRRPDDAYHVLEDARAVIARGWVQDRWFARRPPTVRPHAADPGAAGGPDDVMAACLVGAVLHAVQQRGFTDDLVRAGPALDHLWDAWQESRGLGGPGVAGRAAPRDLRLARVRDLTRWNDKPGRTRDEVFGLIDVAASRAIMAAVAADADSSSADRQWPDGRRRRGGVGGGGSSSECSGSSSSP
jgi:hypothetical protein